ncbi:MAG: hypothetical protein HYX68_19030 [Planctomycetes bacterium]|nr:hypothetical protein [Planctomycetota bacterium]
MARLCLFLQGFFFCLALALMTVAVLAVPPAAIADPPGDPGGGGETSPCKNGNIYCTAALSESTCHSVDRTCFGSITECWCLWDVNKDPKCQCTPR